MKVKPKVKYYTGKNGLRYKKILLATFKGARAKLLADASDKGLHWRWYDKKQVLEIWAEEMITPLD